MKTTNKIFKKINLIFVMILTFAIALPSLLPALNASAATQAMKDSDVSNSASFSTDTIYQIVTDRYPLLNMAAWFSQRMEDYIRMAN